MTLSIRRFVALATAMAAVTGMSGCCFGYGACQGDNVSVRVTAADTGEAVPDVAVNDPRFMCRSNTSSSSCYLSTNVTAGNYALTVTAPGFEARMVTVVSTRHEATGMCGCPFTGGSAEVQLVRIGAPPGDGGSDGGAQDAGDGGG